MEKKIRDRTLGLIEEHKEEIFITCPIDKNHAGDVAQYFLEFFTDMEASLSDQGENADKKLLRDVKAAKEDFNLDEEDFIDIEVLKAYLE